MLQSLLILSAHVQVIFGNVTADISKVVELDGKHDINVQFSYSVDWVPTDIEYKVHSVGGVLD